MVFAAGSCCSQRRLGVAMLNTGKLVHETGSMKMYLAEQKAAEAGVIDIAHNQDSWSMNSGHPFSSDTDCRSEQQSKYRTSDKATNRRDIPSLWWLKVKAVSPEPRVDEADIFESAKRRPPCVLVCIYAGTHCKPLIDDQWRLVSDT